MSKLVRMLLALGLALCLLEAEGNAQSGKPPVVDDAAQARADRVIAIGDTDPVARLNMVLAALELDDAALFALANTHPGIVEQIVTPKYRLAVDYIAALPPPELGRIRRGESIIRTNREMRGEEWKRVVAFAEYFEFKGFKESKIGAVRTQPFEARVIRVEVTFDKNKKKTLSGTMELAWPSTPDRDERSRAELTRHFGARPSRAARGVGAVLALQDGSFEAGTALDGGTWKVVTGVNLGSDVPYGEVALDGSVAVDGAQSVRFFNEEKTRSFPQLVQFVKVTPGTTIRARVHFRADKLRVEYLQREDNVFLGVLFLDESGDPIGPVDKAVGQLKTHAWELLEVQATVPERAVAVQVGLSCAVSGTGWFDGVQVDIVN